MLKMYFYSVFTILLITTTESLATTGGISEVENSRLNFFDIDLFRYCVEGKHGNVVISPVSVKSVLAMLLEGARGRTAAEIRQALRLSPEREDFREQLNSYLIALQGNKSKSVLENTNGVFISNKLDLKRDYETMLKFVYMTEMHRVDFLKPVTATEMINRWASRKTHGLIPDLIDTMHISPSTDILIANALYFKSAWRNAFTKRFTRSGCFYKRGVCKNVEMMELQAELNYAFVNNLRAHAVELPYEGGKYSMILLVPQEKDGWTTLVRDLPYMSLPQITALMYSNDVELTMPKFTVEYSEDLVPLLQKMLIYDLFSSSSNLSGIFKGHSPQVDNFFHKVYIKVDEEGTVAAASTGAMVVPLIGSLVTLTVDRPFLFFIRDNDLGLVLFEGKIDDPNTFAGGRQNGVHDPTTKGEPDRKGQ